MKYFNFSYVLCFLFIYGYTLAGFGLAFNVLFQLSHKMIDATFQPWQTLIGTFRLTFGGNDPLQLISDDAFYDVYSEDCGNKVASVYSIYIIFSFGTIVLWTNMFTASLTNTIESYKFLSKRSILTRCRWLKLCYLLDNCVLLLKLRHVVAPYRMERKGRRLLMHVPKQPTTDKSEILHKTSERLLKLEAQNNFIKGRSFRLIHNTLVCA